MRGSSSFEIDMPADGGERTPRELPHETYWDTSILLRLALARFGLDLRQVCATPAARRALLAVSRHRNGHFFSGFEVDSTVRLRLGFPDGAPILVQHEAWLEDGVATYQMAKSFRAECRVFVRQSAVGVVGCRVQPAAPPEKERTLFISGLFDADVTVYPPLDRWQELAVRVQGLPIKLDDPETAAAPPCLRLREVTGLVEVTW